MMGFWQKISEFLEVPDYSGVERKSFVQRTVGRMNEQAVADFLASGGLDAPGSFKVSAVHACARVIAEGLALPPCYVRQQIGQQRHLATSHPLFERFKYGPNDRQTSYEFREMLGWHLALDSNAYVWINRSKRDGSILELLPVDPGKVSVLYDDSGIWNEPTYYFYGQQIPNDQVWHLKGPSWLSWKGNSTIIEARRAVGLASATETFGAKMFENGARPAGIITPSNGAALTPDQVATLKAQTDAYAGAKNAHKTMVVSGPVNWQSISTTADEAQFIETRKFQIEEICRYFRVSPLKVFQQVGSHSYASVEQAHIAHEQDTDAHWHQRFAQSATLHLLTADERKAGFEVSIDNRTIKQGTTAGERMAYWTAGVGNGLFTQNEARTAEGYDPSDDPEADKLKKAANLTGLPPGPDAAAKDETPKNTG